MWLLKSLAPDFKTIADFRRDNAGAIRSLFKEFVAFLQELCLYGAQRVTVDGCKLKAVNSQYRAFNQKSLAERIKRMEKSVQHYLVKSWTFKMNKKHLMSKNSLMKLSKRRRLK